MKHVRLGVTNPVLGLTFAVLAGLLGFVVALLASAKVITTLVSGLDGVGMAVLVGLPLALILAVLSFILAWKKLNP